jgi:uncharacterized protein YdhG (YjbR/CyaY superfamily)
MDTTDKVERYINQFEGEAKARLETLRHIVRSEVPDAVESVSYGLIGFKYKGKPLVYIGGFTSHTGLYATPNGHEHFKEVFSQYKQGKGSMQFPLSKPLPEQIIRDVVVFRKTQLDK